MLDILVSYLLQILSVFGPLLLFGFLISLCSKWFYACFGSGGRIACYVTGFIGTPIHELSHALFCIIFGHKIVEIKLFQINSADGMLGYVKHTYNSKNIYQRAGNFFIGIAPILVISAILYGFGWLFVPDVFGNMELTVQTMSVQNIKSVFVGIINVLREFFAGALTWQWWLFVFVGMIFALHMNLSRADMKNSTSGLLFVLAAILIADIVLGLIDANLLAKFNNVMFTIGMALGVLLLVSLMISFVVAATFNIIFAIVRKIKR